MEAAEYLRKSRLEEGMDTEEVLARHRKALSDFAEKNNIHIVECYFEVKSGESLYARPEMLRLLDDVEIGKYEAVLVMDLDRLSRGRMRDQSIILDTFRESGTKIITPEKTYDLSDELDDEIAEFKTFMSRREYKIISKRLRRGIMASVNDGWYIANPPYGYRKITQERRPTLEIIPDEAEFVRMMYDMYLNGYGCIAIARHINSLGAKPRRSAKFNRTTVAAIIKNPTYAGKIVWNQKSHIRKGSNGNEKGIVTCNSREDWIIVEGRHPAIIGRETYDKAQEIFAGKYIPSCNDGTVKSPLAGLVRCSVCGKNMQRMAQNKGIPYLLCNTQGCCAGVKFEYVEAAVLRYLQDTLNAIALDRPIATPRTSRALDASLAAIHKELAASAAQKDKLYDLLELGEYDLLTFRDRMSKCKDKLTALEKKEQEIQRSIADIHHADPLAVENKIRAVLQAYEASDPAHRNALLKSVINTVWYTKKKKTKQQDFHLDFDLKGY